MEAVYEESYKVRVIDTDMFGLCRPSSVMNFLQEAATRHAVSLGIGRDDLNVSGGAIWMLVRLKYTLLRPIRTEETVRVKTWYRSPKGAYALRDFELYVGEECVGTALSTWVIADMQTHALLKAEDSDEKQLELL